MNCDVKQLLKKESSYKERLEHRMHPLLEGCGKELTVSGKDGALLHARLYTREDSSAVICISHGFTEFAEKYTEMIYLFLEAGYSVAFMEHRGHGRSHRAAKDLRMVHVDSYDTYVEDYHRFVETVKQELPNQKLLLLAHSMGGCVGALYLETCPEDFSAAVLTSPMLEVDSMGLPHWLCRLYGSFMVHTGHAAEYLGGKAPEGEEKFEEGCSTDRERWAYWQNFLKEHPELHTRAGSLGWMTASLAAAPKAVKGAGTIKIPVLLCQAGKDNMVLPGGQEKFVKNCPNARMVRFEEAKHEIYNSENATLVRYYETILNFFEENS